VPIHLAIGERQKVGGPRTTIGLTWRRTARGIKRLKETVLTISPDYSDRPTADFLALSDIQGTREIRVFLYAKQFRASRLKGQVILLVDARIQQI
jgi:hypothetical protein